MPNYIVERVDISTCKVKADSLEEALYLANLNPEQWDFCAGEPTAILENN